ncbi:colonial-22 [Diaporthe amygdali]|uniref:colonial-22 n=1 Tax=Phomopsis amygdali TaxID=1214568 RepID=UPI0022FE350B|nr:colonial-22 [Diaporthe amygdali]KAJ0115294.1 colonial-22 [Diaporthe amygdali]
MAGPSPDMTSYPLPASGHGVVPPESSVMKLTRGHSCVLCQQRKVRCDKNKPCANCVKAGVDCKVVPPQPPRRRKKKPQERELVDRLKKYEALLSQHGVDFEPIGQHLKSSDLAVDEVDEIEHGIEGLKTSPSSTGQDGVSSDKPPFKWFPYYKDFRTQDAQFRDSSDDGSDGPMIHHAFDKMFDGQDGFPFVIGGSTSSVTNLHPSGVQIFQLWQIYLENVNPLLKVTHTPTIQGSLIEAAANPSKIAKPLEALMFSIYFIAVVSMTDDEQALINAGFMRSPDLVVLQAYVMYLLCIRQYTDPRSLFCLIGIAVRIAQRLGLHRDAEQFHLAPFEVELRRRLWWQLVIFDKRIAEITGSTITALSASKGDCKWPLNINDTDLHVHAKDRIAPYLGPTEMLFCLTRFELTAAADVDGVRPVPNLGATGAKPKFQYSPSPNSSDVVTNAANHNLPMADLDSYMTYIEDRYLKHCDPKVPLHLFTLLMTRQSLSKLRIIDYLCRGHIQQHPDPKTVPAGPERTLRESIFEEGVRVLEYDIMIQGHESLQGFRWYTFMHFPLPVYMYLVGELRYITSGDMCERAWTAILEDYEKRGMANNLRSPIHTALGGALLKAWDAHEGVIAQMGKPPPQQPRLIGILRDRAKSTNTSSKDNSALSQSSGPETGSRVSISSGPSNYVAHQQQQHPQQQHQSEMDMRSAGSSPPIVSAPGTGGMEPMGGGMFPAGGFEGINPHMFSSAVMPSDMDFGAMDWSSVSGWGGAFPTYDPFSQPGMSAP